MGKINFPADVTLIGKGPSFDPERIDWDRLPPFRVCVNETFLVTPSPSASIGVDREIFDLWHEHRTRYPQMLLMHCSDQQRFPYEYRFDPAPQFRYWAAAQAILQFKLLGVQCVNMVGFDAFSNGLPLDPETQTLAKDPALWYSSAVMELGIPWSVATSFDNYRLAADQIRECLGETRINVKLCDRDPKLYIE